jgi:hypothetical protein
MTEKPEKSDACQWAESNPLCPYLSIITETRIDLEIVKKALIGDLATKQTGLSEEVRDIRKSLKRQWTAKDYGTILLGLAALLTAIAASIK